MNTQHISHLALSAIFLVCLSGCGSDEPAGPPPKRPDVLGFGKAVWYEQPDRTEGEFELVRTTDLGRVYRRKNEPKSDLDGLSLMTVLYQFSNEGLIGVQIVASSGDARALAEKLTALYGPRDEEKYGIFLWDRPSGEIAVRTGLSGHAEAQITAKAPPETE